MTIHDRIRQCRIQNNLSQDELAQKLGYTSRSTIAKIESGANDIPQSKVQQFADVLNTTVAYLMGLEEESKPVSEEDIKFALFHGEDGITDEAYAEVLRFAAFVKEKYKKPSKQDTPAPDVEKED